MNRIHLLVALGVCVVLSGCATLPKANPTGQTLIESDPPGARIEINNQYVGNAPVRVDIPRIDPNTWMNNSVTIVANPILPGQQVQTKYIGMNDPTPTHIFFDMNLVSTKNQIDVNINH
jgi:hypothetical protein